jgi:hypothetical protein
VFAQGLRGRQNDQAPQRVDYLHGRGPLKRPLNQAGYMTATVLSQLRQESLARERGPYMSEIGIATQLNLGWNNPNGHCYPASPKQWAAELH